MDEAMSQGSPSEAGSRSSKVNMYHGKPSKLSVASVVSHGTNPDPLDELTASATQARTEMVQ